MIPQSYKCYVQENDSCAALTMETWNISPWLSWAGAYVPSLFQRLLNHTSISGEGPNWRNILFKFNVSCKIDYYAKDPMSICIWTRECSCRIFFYWISFRSRRVFSFLPEQKAKKLSVRFLSSKKLKINNWVVLAVQRQITSQKLVLKMMFHKSISYTYCIAPRKKNLFWLLLSIWMRHDLDKNWKKGLSS